MGNIIKQVLTKLRQSLIPGQKGSAFIAAFVLLCTIISVLVLTVDATAEDNATTKLMRAILQLPSFNFYSSCDYAPPPCISHNLYLNLTTCFVKYRPDISKCKREVLDVVEEAIKNKPDDQLLPGLGMVLLLQEDEALEEVRNKQCPPLILTANYQQNPNYPAGFVDFDLQWNPIPGAVWYRLWYYVDQPVTWVDGMCHFTGDGLCGTGMSYIGCSNTNGCTYGYSQVDVCHPLSRDWYFIVGANMGNNNYCGSNTAQVTVPVNTICK